MKKLAICFLFLTAGTVSYAAIAQNTQSEKKAFLQEQSYLGPINPGNADNY